MIDIYLKNIVKRWKKECGSSSNVLILTPYINSPTAITVTSTIHAESCQLYTLFDAELFINQSSCIHTLIKLCKMGIKIYHLDNLHAKIILVPEKFVSIGSQNITSRGTKNKESSIVITDSEIVKTINLEINKWLVGRKEISLEMLIEMRRVIKPFEKKYRKMKCNISKINKALQDTENERLKKIQENKTKEKELMVLRKKIRLDKIKTIRKKADWLSGRITISVIKEFIEKSAWWYGHPSGKPVRAPKHAQRLEYSNNQGWFIAFGSNIFLVEQAISEVKEDINNYYDSLIKGEVINITNLILIVQYSLRNSVANYNGDKYKKPYKITDKHMLFGTQSINVNDGALYLIGKSGLLNLEKSKSKA